MRQTIKSDIVLTTAFKADEKLSPKEIFMVEVALNEMYSVKIGEKKVYLRFHFKKTDEERISSKDTQLRNYELTIEEIEIAIEKLRKGDE